MSAVPGSTSKEGEHGVDVGAELGRLDGVDLELPHLRDRLIRVLGQGFLELLDEEGVAGVPSHNRVVPPRSGRHGKTATGPFPRGRVPSIRISSVRRDGSAPVADLVVGQTDVGPGDTDVAQHTLFAAQHLPALVPRLHPGQRWRTLAVTASTSFCTVPRIPRSVAVLWET